MIVFVWMRIRGVKKIHSISFDKVQRPRNKNFKARGKKKKSGITSADKIKISI